MNADKFQKLLSRLESCEEAVAWSQGKSLAEVWEQCERGDWLLWLCGRMVGRKGWPTRQEVVLAACDCAEPALKFGEAGEDRPRLAIETARKWARGEATLKQVRAAAADAASYASYASYYAAYAATHAASAAAYAASYASYYASYYAAYAATHAAYAASHAAYAAYAASRDTSLKESADIVRKTLHVPVGSELRTQ